MYYGQQLEKCQAMEEVNGADSDEVGGNIEIWASCGTDHLPNDHFSGHYYFPFIRHMISLNAPQMVVRFPNCHVASGLGNLTTSYPSRNPSVQRLPSNIHKPQARAKPGGKA